jgi:arylsulfatase A-like enzyme
MADDLGYSDLAVHGNSLVETPELDRMARESMQFSQFYVTPVCATTRASLLTGRHFLRTGVSHVHGGKDFLHLDEFTLAEALKEQGYATGMWGKWHSGKTPGYYPWERGFDEAFMARLYQHKDNVGLLNGSEVVTSGWVTDVITDYAIRFIKSHRDQPFFAYLPYLSCHAPLKAPEDLINKYMGKGLSRNLSTLYAMVDQMDSNVGRLLEALEEMNLAENTIVLFLSDNGPAIINNLLSEKDREIRYVNDLRGHKGNIWENGIKSPLFIKWKGVIQPLSIDRLSGVSDLFPTLMELAGPGEMDLPHKLDGRSILPCLEGKQEALVEREIFLYANPGWPPSDEPWTPEGVKDEYRPWKYSGGDNLLYKKQIIGIRKGAYKLLKNPGPTDGSIKTDGSGYVLIDVKKDPKEKQNRVAKKHGKFHEMEASLKVWQEEVFESEHAFEMPRFQLGRDPLVSYPVLAYAPESCSPGVKSASSYITHFFLPGDFAKYAISVEGSGSYTLDIQYSLTGKNKAKFEIEYMDEKQTFELLPDSNSVHISDFRLTAGNASFELINKSTLMGSELKLTEIWFSPEPQD